MHLIPTGPVFSVVTPFTRNGDLDPLALEHYLQAIFREGGRTFYAMAFNSRYSQMKPEEVVAFNDLVCRVVKGLDQDCVVIVGDPVTCDTGTSVEVARQAAESGADVFSSLFSERYYCDDQVVAHFSVLARQSPIPLLVHQMPLISGYGGHLINWPTSTLERVLKLPGIVAMKEDSKEDPVTSFVLQNFAETHAVILSGGGKRQFLDHVKNGARHWLNGVGVFAPHVSIRFFKAHSDGNTALLESIIRDIEEPFFDGPVKEFGWHLAMRSAIEHRGYFPRFERLPLLPLGKEQHSVVGEVLASLPLDEVRG